MDNQFDGKVALITGAGGGMGLASAKAFAEAGASVVLVDINGEAVKEEAEKLKEQGFQALGIECDVSKEEQVKAMVEETVETFGSLDAAFNNAGVNTNYSIDTAEVTFEGYNRIMDTNLRGVWLCMKYELLQMEKQGSGSIVNTSSNAGLRGAPGRAVYSAAKHGVHGLTKSAGLEYASRGIRINAVFPGTIETPMVDTMVKDGDLSREDIAENTPIRRLGQAEEVAEAVVWLSSPAASFVIRQALPVDGGDTV